MGLEGLLPRHRPRRLPGTVAWAMAGEFSGMLGAGILL